jgi:Pin2-interacting protein X1
MGLSERRIKREHLFLQLIEVEFDNTERIGVDPRNLSWSEDKTRFSYKHMTALGWKEQSGIGGSGLSGNPNHIAVVRKLDSSGIGMARAKKEGEDQAAGAGPAGRGLEDVLKRLAAAASPSSSPTPESSALIPVQADAAERRIARNRIA